MLMTATTTNTGWQERLEREIEEAKKQAEEEAKQIEEEEKRKEEEKAKKKADKKVLAAVCEGLLEEQLRSGQRSFIKEAGSAGH